MEAASHDQAIRVSVCLAAYNGDKYIIEQISSILPQLEQRDELIVVDDASTDTTADLVSGICDNRVKLLRSPKNSGYVKTFERAMFASQGDYIFLADQDDVWLPGRVDAMIHALSAAEVVASNFAFFGGKPRTIESIRLRSRDSSRRGANLFALWVGYRPYYGCAMAVRREALDLILPFPPFLLETHDQWIALVGNLRGRIVHLEEETLIRRLHSDNNTPKSWRGLGVILHARWMLLRAFLEASSRIYRKDRAESQVLA